MVTFFFTKVIRHIPVNKLWKYLWTGAIWYETCHKKEPRDCQTILNGNECIHIMNCNCYSMLVQVEVKRGHISLLHYDKYCNIWIMYNNSFDESICYNLMQCEMSLCIQTQVKFSILHLKLSNNLANIVELLLV